MFERKSRGGGEGISFWCDIGNRTRIFRLLRNRSRLWNIHFFERMIDEFVGASVPVQMEIRETKFSDFCDMALPTARLPGNSHIDAHQ